MKKFGDFKLKKGNKVKFTFTYPEGHIMAGPVEFEGIFDKYSVVDNNGYVKIFGPRNIKKAKYVIAEIIYINDYGVKIKFPIEDLDLIREI